MTREEIEAGMTPAGGFTRKQLAEWGVPWPPRKGWRRELEARDESVVYHPDGVGGDFSTAEGQRAVVVAWIMEQLSRGEVDLEPLISELVAARAALSEIGEKVKSVQTGR